MAKRKTAHKAATKSTHHHHAEKSAWAEEGALKGHLKGTKSHRGKAAKRKKEETGW